MQLFVAGINHNDPLGRHRVQLWLAELMLRQGPKPGFVAVEWDKDQLAKVVSQRAYLAELVEEQWPSATADFIQALADAAGYEGDAHIPLLSSVETVWLDQGREANEEEVKKFADFRMNTYRSLAKGLEKFDTKALEYMSVSAWNRANAQNEAPDLRDPKFAERLLAACNTSTRDWAIAILGANHAANLHGMAIDLLKHSNISFHVTTMAPENSSA